MKPTITNCGDYWRVDYGLEFFLTHSESAAHAEFDRILNVLNCT